MLEGTGQSSTGGCMGVCNKQLQLMDSDLLQHCSKLGSSLCCSSSFWKAWAMSIGLQDS